MQETCGIVFLLGDSSAECVEACSWPARPDLYQRHQILSAGLTHVSWMHCSCGFGIIAPFHRQLDCVLNSVASAIVSLLFFFFTALLADTHQTEGYSAQQHGTQAVAERTQRFGTGSSSPGLLRKSNMDRRSHPVGPFSCFWSVHTRLTGIVPICCSVQQDQSEMICFIGKQQLWVCVCSPAYHTHLYACP